MLICIPQLLAKLRAGRNASAGTVTKGKVTVKGSNASVQHTINEDERTEFTRHINSVGVSFFLIQQALTIFRALLAMHISETDSPYLRTLFSYSTSAKVR